MMEIWRDISGYEGFYEVSNRGRIKSLARRIEVAPSPRSANGYTREIASRILKIVPVGPAGRSTVSLWKGHQVSVLSVPALVLSAFLGPRPEGCLACHRDDDAQNNDLENLYWGTPKENAEDKVKNGGQPYGEACQSAKLTAKQVQEIRALKGHMSQTKIGEKFGIAQAQVSRILSERHWKT